MLYTYQQFIYIIEYVFLCYYYNVNIESFFKVKCNLLCWKCYLLSKYLHLS